MGDLEAKKAQVLEIEKQISQLQYEADALRKEIATAMAKWKVGSRLRIQKHGRDDEIWEICDIRPGYSHSRPRYMGSKMKKDGSISSVIKEIYCWDIDKAELVV